MGLFWQIVIFLIVAAALGFAIGWLTRGVRSQGEGIDVAPRQSSAEAAVADERDRLQTELRAARDGHAKLETSLAEAQGLADTRASRVRELEQAEASSKERIAGLEKELSAARPVGSEPGTATASRATPAAQPRSTAEPVPSPADETAGAPPQALSGPEGEPDDLKQISGIGPGIEKTLHEVGIYHFHQIAAFTPDNIAWVNQRLRFKGRIEREDWVGQAKKLVAGEPVDRV